MSLAVRIRRAEDPVGALLKRADRRALQAHVPVAGLTRPVFGLLYRLHVAAREGLMWALRFGWYEPLFRSQCAAVGERFQMEQLPYLTGRGRIVLGGGVRLSGKPTIAFGNRLCDRPELTIGDDTFVGHQCCFHVARSVTVGRHCLLAGGVRVSDHDGHPLDAADRRAGRPPAADAVRPVVIGDDVWVGAGAVILKGVTVGDRAVIGAGAVVARDVPPDVVVAGNPARIIKHLPAPAEA